MRAEKVARRKERKRRDSSGRVGCERVRVRVSWRGEVRMRSRRVSGSVGGDSSRSCSRRNSGWSDAGTRWSWGRDGNWIRTRSSARNGDCGMRIDYPSLLIVAIALRIINTARAALVTNLDIVGGRLSVSLRLRLVLQGFAGRGCGCGSFGLTSTTTSSNSLLHRRPHCSLLIHRRDWQRLRWRALELVRSGCSVRAQRVQRAEGEGMRKITQKKE